jgi:hypothetical protein
MMHDVERIQEPKTPNITSVYATVVKKEVES